MSRPSFQEWAMSLAVLTATRSTCLRRHVGCVLFNSRHHILSTGYNGVAAGMPHCNDMDGDIEPWCYPNRCEGAQSASGQNLDGCEAIHAEQNALLQCRNVYEIEICVTTTSPCVTCVKLLLNTSCQEILYREEYPHTAAKDLWVKANRIWSHI